MVRRISYRWELNLSSKEQMRICRLLLLGDLHFLLYVNSFNYVKYFHSFTTINLPFNYLLSLYRLFFKFAFEDAKYLHALIDNECGELKASELKTANDYWKSSRKTSD
jgi:hypothetical protein